MKVSIKLLICILLLTLVIPLNSYAKVVPSKNNTETEIAQYCSENNNDLTGVSKEILRAWYITITSGPNGGRSAPFKAVVAQAAKDAGIDTEAIYNNRLNYNYDFKDIEDETSLGFWKPSSNGNNAKLTNIAGKILGVIQAFGSVVSVIVLVIIGIKYMLASVEEKAKYKETMIPYIVGCILIFATSNIASILYNIGISLNS